MLTAKDPGSNPGQGTKIPKAVVWPKRKKKKKLSVFILLGLLGAFLMAYTLLLETLPWFLRYNILLVFIPLNGNSLSPLLPSPSLPYHYPSAYFNIQSLPCLLYLCPS